MEYITTVSNSIVENYNLSTVAIVYVASRQKKAREIRQHADMKGPVLRSLDITIIKTTGNWDLKKMCNIKFI